jgi:hypothetical protein
LETVNVGTSPCGRRLNPEGSPLRISQLIVPLTAAILTALPFGAAVDAALLINVESMPPFSSTSTSPLSA